MQTSTSAALTLEMTELEKEWLASPQRKFLLALLKKRILSQPLQITSAVCLGLGSLSIQPRVRLDFPRRLTKRPSEDSLELAKDECYYSSSSEIEGEATVFGERRDSDSAKQGIGYDGAPRNERLYHLLLFETVMTCLRSKFDIEDCVFQDPDFSAGDERFLRNRGHKLIPYPTADTDPFLLQGDYPFDKSLVEHVSSRVFVFAPSLVFMATVDMLLTLKPVLYWGFDICGDIPNPYLVHPRSPGYLLRGSYTELAFNFAFVRASLLGRRGIEDGFMYPINTTDEKMKKKLEQRISKVGIDVEKMKELLEKVEQDRRARPRENEKS